MKLSLYQRISLQELQETHSFYLQEETKITKTVDPWAGKLLCRKLDE
jgi:hypothetical protein